MFATFYNSCVFCLSLGDRVDLVLWIVSEWVDGNGEPESLGNTSAWYWGTLQINICISLMIWLFWLGQHSIQEAHSPHIIPLYDTISFEVNSMRCMDFPLCQPIIPTGFHLLWLALFPKPYLAPSSKLSIYSNLWSATPLHLLSQFLPGKHQTTRPRMVIGSLW